MVPRNTHPRQVRRFALNHLDPSRQIDRSLICTRYDVSGRVAGWELYILHDLLVGYDLPGLDL